MSRSDLSSDDESSSDESITAAKRLRADTYGASSTTSHASLLQESDGEPGETPNTNRKLNSPSDNCLSSNNQYEHFRPAFEDNDAESDEDEMHSSFQNTNDMFSSTNYNQNEDTAFSGDYSEKSKRMMTSMGFKPGKGLGKFEHGRTQPVEASIQKGRRGFGAKPSIVGEVSQNFKWSPEESKPEAEEKVTWIASPLDEPLSEDSLEEWLKKGRKKLTIDDETEFVEPHILKGVIEAKTIFDSLDDEDLRNARFRSNPYETIGSVIFLNRAAVKMANLDAIFDFMFTNPKRQNGEIAVDKKEILYFADVCAGPGGFSEYILYRKGWRAKGFGFTLKGSKDFKLSDFYAGTPETFNTFYGVKDDGNIFDPDNLTSLKEHVLKQTDDKGVHFLMADGGFSVEGQENIQEILSKQLYLCQCLAALMLVRTEGHFVVKLFDIFTLFSVGLIYIMYRCFDRVSIHKPVTSRPANSERYLVCAGKRRGTEPVERHLLRVAAALWAPPPGPAPDDVTQLVPLAVIRADTDFYKYIYNSNCVLGEKQIKNLLKIAAFSKDKNLKEINQAEMKATCLKLWQIPDAVRTQPERLNPDETLARVLAAVARPPAHRAVCAFKLNVLNKPPAYLEGKNDLDRFKNVYDWQFMFLSSARNSPDLRIFIGCGGKQVLQLETNTWRSVVDLHLTLPARTLIYGEIVKEYRGQGNNQIYSKALHIIDAMMLGGVDISHYSLSERINQCNMFCSALNKPFDNQALPLRCKRIFGMEQFPSAVHNLEIRAMKRIKRAVTINTPNRDNIDDQFYVVGSVLFLKEIKEPWGAQISKKSGYKYYYCIGKDKRPRSEYHIPDDAKLDMAGAFVSRAVWAWEPAPAVLEGAAHRGLARADLDHHIALSILK